MLCGAGLRHDTAEIMSERMQPTVLEADLPFGRRELILQFLKDVANQDAADSIRFEVSAQGTMEYKSICVTHDAGQDGT